jgi:exonuclease III
MDPTTSTTDLPEMRAARTPRRTLRIATWNLLAGGSSQRNSHWTMVRERIAPDILLTQECNAVYPGHPTRIWQEAVQGRWGTGLYANARIRPIAVAGFAGWVVGGELSRSRWLTSRPLRIFSVHCPADSHGYIRTMHQILDALVNIARDADLVLGGDFNVAAGYRGPAEDVKMSRAERTLLDRMSFDFGLIACWQTAHPLRPLGALRWSGNRSAPYHCDGIFVPHHWRARLQSCEVLSDAGWHALSDHNPVVADFE